MKSTSRSSLSLFIILLLCVESALSQKRFVPHTITAGIDVPSVFRSIASSGRTLGELQLTTNIASHLAIIEYGFENVERSGESFDFDTRGPYFRLGVDFTLNPKNPHGHKIFTGFRYAQSNFKNSIVAQSSSEIFDAPISAENNDLRGSWLEWTMGMKIVINQYLGMGYTIRYKFSPDITGGGELSSFDLPGYGRAEKTTNFGLSYYLFYRLNFRKTQGRRLRGEEEEEKQ